MSENNLKLDENEIHYVYGDQEYVLGEDEINPELRDLICSDGLRAILVDGQYIVTDNQAILLQAGDSNLTQYYINDSNESFIINGEDTSVNALLASSECVQLVEEDTNDSQQIAFYTNDDSNNEYAPVQDMDDDEDIEGIQDEEGNIYPFKRIKLEVLNFDEFVEQQGGLVQEGNDNSMEYTILEAEDAIRPASYDTEESSQSSESLEKANQIIDLSKITGRNLITGQTVTLDSYMEKLKERLHKSNGSNSKKSPKRLYNDTSNATLKSPPGEEESKKAEFSDLLDKKISIGKTKSGKKIVGKIIHVERKIEAKKEALAMNDAEKNEEEAVRSENCDENAEENEEEAVKSDDQTKVVVRKCTMSVESFEQISKTLGGVMQMESVRKKLENKNIVVKLVEKRYNSETGSYVKSTSYSYGYMEEEPGVVGGDEVADKWKFVPDQDTQNVLLRDYLGIQSDEDGHVGKSAKFPITTSLTILITYEKVGNKTVRVNLNPAPGNLCTICAQYFKTNLQLRQHMHLIHNAFSASTNTCEICEKSFEDPQKLQEHRDLHVFEGFACPKCKKAFSTQSKLHKHMASHDVNSKPLKCLVCDVRCVNKWAWKKHLLTHTGAKPFCCGLCNKQFATQSEANFHKKTHFPDKLFHCNVCMRTFSRHSNLLRHAEIHKGTGALYKCEICYCSYNYISSLTRHMVQNHIDAGECKKKG